jgi:hypothetical protein
MHKAKTRMSRMLPLAYIKYNLISHISSLCGLLFWFIFFYYLILIVNIAFLLSIFLQIFQKTLSNFLNFLEKRYSFIFFYILFVIYSFFFLVSEGFEDSQNGISTGMKRSAAA